MGIHRNQINGLLSAGFGGRGGDGVCVLCVQVKIVAYLGIAILLIVFFRFVIDKTRLGEHEISFLPILH